MELIIEYEDSGGLVTQREITVKKLDDGLLKSVCHLRNSARSFQFARVRSIYDPATGEALNISEIRKTLMSLSDDGLGALPSSAGDGVRFLMALAASDGEIAKEEVERIIQYACDHPDCEDLDISEIIREISSFSFKANSENLGKIPSLQRKYGDDTNRHFVRAVRNVVDAEGRVAEEEVSF